MYSNMDHVVFSNSCAKLPFNSIHLSPELTSVITPIVVTFFSSVSAIGINIKLDNLIIRINHH